MANRYFIGDKRDELLDVQAVANLVHVSTNTIRRLSDDGKINAIGLTPGETEDIDGKISRFS